MREPDGKQGVASRSLRGSFAALTSTWLLLSGCFHSLPLNAAQVATMSPEAVAVLKEQKLFRLPFITPSTRVLHKIRAKVATLQEAQLEEMKKRFRPTVEQAVVDGVHVVIIQPRSIPKANEGKVLLFVHGGGYIMGSPTERLQMLLTNELGIKTISIDYSLAPEAKFPVALEECLKVYRSVVSTYGKDNVIAAAASAGGTHLLGTLLRARALGLPMVRAIALFSPSVDLGLRGDSVIANDGRDVLAYKDQADKIYLAPFLGNASVDDPLVSPVRGTYDNAFPATIIVTGTRDGFLSGCVRLYWKLREAGVPVELSVSEGMWHGFFQFPDMPEAIRARRAAGELLLGHTRVLATP